MDIRIRGKDYKINIIKDSSVRRSRQYYNNIFLSLRKIGLSTDDVDVTLENNPIKRIPASASWYIDGHHCHFSFNKMERYVDNINVVSKVIELSVNELLNEEITAEEFISGFKEDKNFKKQRDEAREFFGLEEDHIDLESINAKYKQLAKELHPDMPTGDVLKFKELNTHHKTLKRELE